MASVWESRQSLFKPESLGNGATRANVHALLVSLTTQAANMKKMESLRPSAANANGIAVVTRCIDTINEVVRSPAPPSIPPARQGQQAPQGEDSNAEKISARHFK